MPSPTDASHARASAPSTIVFLGMALSAGCGPTVGEDTRISDVCGNEDPIRLTEQAAIASYGATAPESLGDDLLLWSLGADGLVGGTLIVDPCGNGVQDVIENTAAVRFGPGWAGCSAGRFAWTESFGQPAHTLSVACPQCFARTNHGIVLVDGEGQLLHFDAPTSPGVVLAHDTSCEAGFSDHQLRRFFHAGRDHVWMLESETNRLFRAELSTGEKVLVAEDVVTWEASPWEDVLIFEHRDLGSLVDDPRRDEPRPVEGRIAGFGTGLLLTSDGQRLYAYELAGDAVHELEVAGNTELRMNEVHAELSSIFVLMQSVDSASTQVVHADLVANTLSTIDLEHQAYSIHDDPHFDGVLVHVVGSDFSSGIVRVGRDGHQRNLADNLGVGTTVFAVSDDDRIVYTRHTEDTSAELRIRYPTGSDRMLAEDAYFITSSISSNAFDSYDGVSVDLGGDVLYVVRSGSDEGVWRMPFARRAE